MTNNPENIPSEIFDWMQSSSFSSLHAIQKAEVEKYLSPAEYDELHSAMDFATFGTETISSGKLQRKANLLQAFDAKYGKKKEIIVLSRTALWRAAAIALLLVSCWMSLRLFNKNAGANSPQIAKADTVFLQQIITSAPDKVYDTIYLKKENTSRPSGSNKNSNKQPATRIVISPGNNELSVLSAKDIKSTQNLPKKNSLRDDSMAGKFGFVSL